MALLEVLLIIGTADEINKRNEVLFVVDDQTVNFKNYYLMTPHVRSLSKNLGPTAKISHHW